MWESTSPFDDLNPATLSVAPCPLNRMWLVLPFMVTLPIDTVAPLTGRTITSDALRTEESDTAPYVPAPRQTVLPAEAEAMALAMFPPLESVVVQEPEAELVGQLVVEPKQSNVPENCDRGADPGTTLQL
jgi:hypothetical protein